MAKILIVAELANGAVREATFELVSVARALGGEIVSVVLGNGISMAAESLAKRGGGTVLAFDDPALETYSADTSSSVIQAAISAQSPSIVLLSNTPNGWDVAPKVAASLDMAIVSDAFRIEAQGGEWLVTRRVFNGKLDAQLVAASPAIVTMQPGAAEAYRGAEAGKVETASVPSLASRSTYIETKKSAGGGHDLTKAEIIVSGGRGLQKPENFDAVLQPLCNVLSAQMGASRPVVDAGWKPHEYQVGSSGQIVSPKLYIAVGISGAIQHLVGMKGSNYIIAINKDRDAPIFEVADLGVVGDLFEIVPALVQAVAQAKGGG
jgi:electron transfer flavoprotein alpha subunit